MPKWRQQQITHKKERIQQRKSQTKDSGNPHFDGVFDNQDPNGIDTRRAKGSQAPRTFSQPSVMSNGDKGIFVTTDIGREKKGLIELCGILEEYLEEHGLLDMTKDTMQTSEVSANEDENTTSSKNLTKDVASGTDIEVERDDDSDDDIEASIRRELQDLQSPSPEQELSHIGSNKPTVPPSKRPIKPFQLITLDVPCVSFVRFHPLHPAYAKIDPVHITHSICDTAMRTQIPRSRYIRRLSPICMLTKILAQGLEKCSATVLPPHFHRAITVDQDFSSTQEEEVNNRSVTTFAIRPNIRNNEISRDDVIRYIADQVNSLGRGGHKVDLKSYQKGIVVEIYRGWIGMSVVDNRSVHHRATQNVSEIVYPRNGGTNQSGPDRDVVAVDTRQPLYEYGYEELKRFNLAEIYTSQIQTS